MIGSAAGWWWGALAALTLSTTGCDFWYNRVPSPDDLWHVIPWFDHMIKAKYIRPYQTAAVPRYTPPGIVPVTGGEPDWSAEWTTGKTTTANALRNPYAAGAGDSAKAWPAGARRGRYSPRRRGRGRHAVRDLLLGVPRHRGRRERTGLFADRRAVPADRTGPRYSDGYIYSIIRYGRGVMPRYGDKVYLPSDRWAIVNHVRKLQGQAPLAPEPAGAAVGIPPAPSATGSTGERPR